MQTTKSKKASFLSVNNLYTLNTLNTFSQRVLSKLKLRKITYDKYGNYTNYTNYSNYAKFFLSEKIVKVGSTEKNQAMIKIHQIHKPLQAQTTYLQIVLFF